MKKLVFRVSALLLISFFLNSYFYSEDRIVHFSIDDTIIVFQNLTRNEQKYKSAFDEPLLKKLKKIHEQFNLKVSMYVFYETGNFSLDNCTSKFASDFLENADWLKFCSHTYEGLLRVNSELVRITGSPLCITDTVRFHCFEANKEELYGINTLLTADSDIRPSYFLTNEQEKKLLRTEKILLLWEFIQLDVCKYFRISKRCVNTQLLKTIDL